MDTDTPNTPKYDPISRVDASQPFRSVKEAVSIFGDRLFFKGDQLSPKHPDIVVGNKASYTSTDLAQNHDNPINLAGEQDVAVPSFNEPSDQPEVTLGPTEALDVVSKEEAESPMYEPTPSPENPQQESLTESADEPTNPFGEQVVGPSLDGPSYPLKITLGLSSELPSIPSKQVVESPTITTLAQILSISDYEGYFRENKLRTRKSLKKKPIIPLVTDLLIWKKASPTHGISELNSDIYAREFRKLRTYAVK